MFANFSELVLRLTYACTKRQGRGKIIEQRSGLRRVTRDSSPERRTYAERRNKSFTSTIMTFFWNFITLNLTLKNFYNHYQFVHSDVLKELLLF